MNSLISLAKSITLIVYSLREFFVSNGAKRQLLLLTTIKQIYYSGVKGLLPVVIVGFSVGVVVSFVIGTLAIGPIKQIIIEIQAGVNIFLVAKLFGPLIIMFVVLARSGSAICIELGYMKVQHELEALSSMGISPLQYVIAPRILAMIISVIVLSMFGISAGVVGSVLVAVISLDLPFWEFVGDYFNIFFRILHVSDILIITLYSAGFGVFISGIPCYFGINVKQSLAEVPTLTTKSVVLAMICCILYYTYVTVIIIAIRDVDFWVGFPVSSYL
jgi:phospholipid/cholesterol/gamma-HCH transport system permease protein